MRRSDPSGALGGRAGGRYARDAREGGDADRDGADDREHQLPGFRRHGVFHDAVRGVVAGDGGGRDEGERDQQPRPQWTDQFEQKLAKASVSPAATRPMRMAPSQPAPVR